MTGLRKHSSTSSGFRHQCVEDVSRQLGLQSGRQGLAVFSGGTGVVTTLEGCKKEREGGRASKGLRKRDTAADMFEFPPAVTTPVMEEARATCPVFVLPRRCCHSYPSGLNA